MTATASPPHARVRLGQRVQQVVARPRDAGSDGTDRAAAHRGGLGIRQAEHERNLLLEKLRSFQSELEEKDNKVLKQQTEIEMFNELLEKRVAEATDDYRRSMLILESAIKSSRSVDFVLKLHAESLLAARRGAAGTIASPRGDGCCSCRRRVPAAPLPTR